MAVALIVAAGRGERLGSGRPKALVTLGGKAMLQWSVDALQSVPSISSIVVALPESALDAAPAGTVAVAGGMVRSASVRNALTAAAEGSGDEPVIVHDAARPLASAELFQRALDELLSSGADAVIAAAPVSDTIKEVGADGVSVERTLSRERLWAVQTPQVFRRSALEAVLREAGDDLLASATDDAWLIERAGGTVRVVDAGPGNFKVTTPTDLKLAELLVQGTSLSRVSVRTGLGYDCHQFAEGRPLVLGGVAIPYDRGLAGHSDADVLTHAVIDALLGAAGLGDIGEHFPDTEERYRDADSIGLLQAAVQMLDERGYRVVNVDVTVIIERPHLKDFKPQMRARLAEALGVELERVNVKATRGEGMGFIGRQEGAAACSVATIAVLGSGEERTDTGI